jgi:hypothetical protein
MSRNTIMEKNVSLKGLGETTNRGFALSVPKRKTGTAYLRNRDVWTDEI